MKEPPIASSLISVSLNSGVSNEDVPSDICSLEDMHSKFGGKGVGLLV